MDEIILEQILSIRDAGKINMFDVNGVMRIANEEGFHELVVYLLDHKSEYSRFILTGKTEENDEGGVL